MNDTESGPAATLAPAALALPAGSGPTAGPRRGLVLGSGGLLGVAWTVAALSALQDATGWDARTAEVIIGTSAGSIPAGFLGSGVSVARMLAHQQGMPSEGDAGFTYDYDLDSGGAAPLRPRLRLGSPALLRAGLRKPGSVPVLATLAAAMPLGRGSLAPLGALMESVALPQWPMEPQLWILTMDYDTGQRVAFGHPGAPPASLGDAVRASCSIPGWYEPVEIGGRRYIDGGAVSSSSLDLLEPLGLDEVYVLSPLAAWSYDRPPTVGGRLERRYRRVVTRRIARGAQRLQAAGTQVTVLAPGAEDLRAFGTNLMDPSRREAVLATSLRTSAARMGQLLAGRPGQHAQG